MLLTFASDYERNIYLSEEIIPKLKFEVEIEMESEWEEKMINNIKRILSTKIPKRTD